MRDHHGYILAGGESSRMGSAKGLLEIGGEPMVVRTARLVESITGTATVIGRTSRYETLGLQVIDDDWPGAGPLGAIATALHASDATWNLILACDLPYLTRDWLEFLVRRAVQSQADAVLPMNALGAEPLCAMYHKRSEAVVLGAVERGVRKVTEGLERLCVEKIEPSEWKAFDSEGFLFKNMNSPEDYEEAKTRLDRRARPRKK
ncbi:MAG TPA: molybdenum cofactor guanylyltransferase [Candidatus Acidoferrales bacterium]|nr:molybdenum cofactor guanylyltransferase [Candidatus Acidoferrales bacterium]